MVQDSAIFTMADQYKVAHVLSNGAIFNDLERPLTWFSRSTRPFFDTEYLTNGYRYGHKANRKPHPSFRMAPVSMTLSDL